VVAVECGGANVKEESAMPGREQVSFQFKCSGCKQKGSVTWEEDENPVYGREPDFKSVSEGFRRSKKYDRPNHFGVVCKTCGIEVSY
jgi:hypothetical protein